ncbi:MAG: ribosome maturation factor RimM [Betaproteobacteria bacterium]|jgi:16S rRNA processing protein RimM|nr:ribosome maturation factor RimM [Betaproteobacteria bacterium]
MIVLGRITAPFGVRGWVKIQTYGDAPQAWAKMPRWWSGSEEQAADATWLAMPLAECKPHGKGLVARFDGVEDCNAAEKLVGRYVGAPREALPNTAEDEYYWADLIGLEVVNLAGERLGRIAELVRAGAHEVIDVRDESGNQRLLPFVAAVIKEVDLSGRRIQVDWGRDW